MISIYKVTSPDDRIFIGRTTNFKNKLKVLKYNSTAIKKYIHLSTSLKKYGFENHKIEIIEECDELVMRERHQYWVSYYKSNSYKFIEDNGLNCDSGGAGSGPCTEERKLKIGEANKGKKRDESFSKLMRELGIKNRNLISFKEKENLIKEYLETDIGFVKLFQKYQISNRYLVEIFEEYNVKKSSKSRELTLTTNEVINIVTKHVFKSVKYAAVINGIEPNTLLRKLNGVRYNDTNFRYLNEEKNKLKIKPIRYSIGSAYYVPKKLNEYIENGDVLMIIKKLNDTFAKGKLTNDILEKIDFNKSIESYIKFEPEIVYNKLKLRFAKRTNNE